MPWLNTARATASDMVCSTYEKCVTIKCHFDEACT